VTGGDEYYLGRGERPADPLDHAITDASRARIVPHLLELLAREHSSHIVTSAMLALAKLGGGGETPEHAATRLQAGLLPRLADPNQTISEVAALSLGILGLDEGVLPLAALLDDGDEGRRLCGASSVDVRTRAFAAYALGLIGGRTERVDVRRFVVQKLCAAFEADRGAVFDVRVACLLALGLAPLPSDPAWGLAQDGRLLPALCREAQIEWTLRVLADRDEAYLVRAHAPTSAARLLSGLEAPALRTRAVELLLGELAPRSSAPRELRQGCTLALGELADADGDALDVRVRARLTELAREAPDQQQRAFALIALAQVGGRPGSGADEPLAGVPAIREHFARILTQGRNFLVPWSALSIGVMERALDDAGGFGSQDMKDLLRDMLAEESSPGTLGALCIALGIVRDPAARAVVAGTLERTGDPDARAYALLALGMLRERESIPTIQAVLEESRYNPVLVQSAAIALALIHDPEIVPGLLEMLDRSTGLATSASICYSLGRIGDARAIDALLEMSGLPVRTDLARGMATEALGALADRDDLPWNTALSWGVNYAAAPATLSARAQIGVLDMY
jgi:HEAT repeat protein